MAENDSLYDENGISLKSSGSSYEGKGFNSRSYANLLENKILSSILSKYKTFKPDNDISQLTYIQDNSRVHTGRIIKEKPNDDKTDDNNEIYTPIGVIKRFGIDVEPN